MMEDRETRTTEVLVVGGGIAGSLFDVAEIVLRAAQGPEESSRSNFYEDRPVRDDARWLVNLLLVRGPDRPVLRQRPVEFPYVWSEQVSPRAIYLIREEELSC